MQHESAVEDFYRHIAKLFIVRQSVGAVTLWAFIWGTAVLAIRTTQDVSAEVLLWGLIGVPLALVFAVRSASRQLPDRTTVRALLDDRGDCGGLLMAGAERDMGRWRRVVPEVATPRLSWSYRRPMAIFAASIIYILLGFFLPIDREAWAGDSRFDINRETERLVDQVRILKEEKILDTERAETLTKKLDQLHSDSAGKDPAKTLEALDHLNEVMKQTGKRASESLARDSNELGKLETAAEALQELATELNEKAATELMAELAAMAEKAAAENEQFKKGMDREIDEAIAGKKLSREQLGKLSASAEKCRESIKKSAEKLYKGKLIDSDQLKACSGESKNDSKELADYLKQKGGKCRLGDAMDALAALGDLNEGSKSLTQQDGEGPGRGGVNEGPGAAPIQFGDQSSENGAKFRPEALPPGNLAGLKESQMAGVSGTTPQRDPKLGSPTAGALNGAMTGGGSANTVQILPQHKAAVERYFDRPAK